MRHTNMALCGRRLGANGWGLALLLATAAAGCIGGQTGSEAKDSSPLDRTEPCDPLGPRMEPIELGEILGAGRSADGTLYVADQPGDSGDPRVFVSEDGALVRRRVNGTAESSERDATVYTLNAEGTSGAFTLVIERSPAQTRMARAPGSQRALSVDALGPDAEQLDVVGADALRGLTLRNLPGDITVEYLARDEGGELLLVLRPRDDFQYEDARLFYGPSDEVTERKVASFTRARDGGTTHIVFALDGADADAFFPIMFDGSNFVHGDASLTIAGHELALDWLDPDAEADLIESAMLRCLRQ